MLKKIILWLSFISCITLAIAVYFYHQPQNIEKSFTLYNISEINLKRDLAFQQVTEYKVELEVSMTLDRNIFKADSYKGILTLNNELEYITYGSDKLDDSYYIWFVPISYNRIDIMFDRSFILSEKNKFEYVFISDHIIDIDENELKLVGPAKSVDEAVEKFLHHWQ